MKPTDHRCESSHSLVRSTPGIPNRLTGPLGAMATSTDLPLPGGETIRHGGGDVCARVRRFATAAPGESARSPTDGRKRPHSTDPGCDTLLLESRSWDWEPAATSESRSSWSGRATWNRCARPTCRGASAGPGSIGGTVRCVIGPCSGLGGRGASGSTAPTRVASTPTDGAATTWGWTVMTGRSSVRSLEIVSTRSAAAMIRSATLSTAAGDERQRAARSRGGSPTTPRSMGTSDSFPIRLAHDPIGVGSRSPRPHPGPAGDASSWGRYRPTTSSPGCRRRPSSEPSTRSTASAAPSIDDNADGEQPSAPLRPDATSIATFIG